MAEFTRAFNRLVEEDRPGAPQFRDVVSRLCSHGVLVHGDSILETELYEAAVHLEEEVRDYLSLLGCLLHHNPQLRYFRLFPPAARSPIVANKEGSREDESESASTAMRRRGNPHVSGALLALRTVYQQKITCGADFAAAPGEVSASIEEVYVTMKTRLHRDPATTQADRKGALRELDETWRVIRIPVDADTDDRQTRIVIRPMIADLVGESAALRAEEDARELSAESEDKETAS